MIRKVCDGSWVDSWDWPTPTLPRGRRLPLSIPDVNHCPNSYSSVKVQILLFLIKGAQKFDGNSAYLQNMFYFQVLCPGFSGDLITKSCPLWQNILKTERQISGMIPSPSAPPPSYNQVELWSRLESSSSTPPPQQVIKEILFSKEPSERNQSNF